MLPRLKQQILIWFGIQQKLILLPHRKSFLYLLVLTIIVCEVYTRNPICEITLTISHLLRMEVIMMREKALRSPNLMPTDYEYEGQAKEGKLVRRSFQLPKHIMFL